MSHKNTRTCTLAQWLENVHLKDVIRQFSYMLGLSPACAILNRIRRHGIDLSQVSAIELFGGTGSMFTREIAANVSDLEAWEIDPIAAHVLQHNIPYAKVRLIDSVQEVKCTQREFGLVSIDNPMSAFGSGYCEHFDLFPHAFRLAAPRSVFIVTFIPYLNNRAKHRFSYLFNPQHLGRRAAFYGTYAPENVSVDQTMSVFAEFAEQTKLFIDWHFAQPRNDIIYALVFGVHRQIR